MSKFFLSARRLMTIRPGSFFTLKFIPAPKSKDVFMICGFDSKKNKYKCVRCDDFSHVRFFSPVKKVFLRENFRKD